MLSAWLWAGVYLALATAAYAPLWTAPLAVLPTGKVVNGVVSLFNAWTIWWNADRLQHGLSGYWDAPIFWPERGMFALSEPQPLALSVAPVVWLWGPTAAFHVYFVLNLALNGIFAHRLARRLGAGAWTAGLAGALVSWHPLVFAQPELIQYLPLWPAIWSWEVIVRPYRPKPLGQGLELAAAVVLSFAASLYLGAFNVLLIVPAGLALAVARGGRQHAMILVLGLTLGALLILPLVLPVVCVLRQHGMPRTVAETSQLSATTGDWLTVPEGSLLPLPAVFPHKQPRALLPGWIRTAFALAGLAIVLFAPPPTRTCRGGVVFVGAVAILAVVASFGPNVNIGGISPWELAAQWFYPIGWIRSPYRFAYLAQTAILIVAAIGVQVVVDKLSHGRGLWRWWFGETQRGTLLVTAACGLVLMVEVLPARPFFTPAPRFWDPPDWIQFLARTNAPGAVLLLHFPQNGRLPEHELTVRAMLWQKLYRRPLVNGYSGFAPRSWAKRSQLWTKSPYSLECLEDLEKIGAWFLIRPREFPAPAAENIGPYRLRLLFRSSAGVEIWQLLPAVDDG